LATGSQAMNVFRPEPALKKQSKLAALPEYTSWDKVEIQGEISLKALVAQIEQRYGAKVVRLYPPGDDKTCIFESTQVEKLNWKIEIGEGGKVLVEPEAGVYGAWPQLRMAVTQLARLPEGGAARKMFEQQVASAQKSLAGVKNTFAARFEGNASQAYVAIARPSDEAADKQKYFDAVFAKRNYVAFAAHLLNSDGEEAELPLIRYTFR